MLSFGPRDELKLMMLVVGGLSEGFRHLPALSFLSRSCLSFSPLFLVQ